MRTLETLIDALTATCAALPDRRKAGGLTYSMADIGVSAFSLFFMQSESFLAYQRELEDGRKTANCQTLFGMTRIPTDNHIRTMLDPVHPRHLQPVFDTVLDTLVDGGSIKQFQKFGDRTLIALDGTEYFCSQKLGCQHCLTRKRANGKIESYHAMLAATIVAPGSTIAVPLMPEFIAKEDGAEKQDCERNAVKRWLGTHGERMRRLRPIYLGDDLFACHPPQAFHARKRAGMEPWPASPVVEAMLVTGDVLLTAKPASHKALYDFMHGAAGEELICLRKEGARKLSYRYRWFNEVPLRDSKDALSVNWLGLTVTDAKGRVVYDGAWVTSLSLTPQTVADTAACARARWKIENESFNVLKNNGYHLEHNFGHGKQHLAMTFAALNLLAFAFHTVCDLLEPLWIRAREAKRARTRFFQHIQTLTAYLVFPSWAVLMNSLINSKPPPEIERQVG
jgi:hypothetical protein